MRIVTRLTGANMRARHEDVRGCYGAGMRHVAGLAIPIPSPCRNDKGLDMMLWLEASCLVVMGLIVAALIVSLAQ